LKALYLFLFIIIAIFSSSAQSTESSSGQLQWDFDHQVQFKQTDLKAGKYHLLVIAKQDVEFSKLATFLIRRSLRLCKGYSFKIEVLEGVERFDDKLSFPNMIMPSLSANIECSKA
jgi:hypothetical protein